MKKIIKFTLILIVAILVFAPCISVAYIEDTDIKVNDLYYRVLSEDNKTVEITGIYNSEFKKNVDVPSNVEIESKTYTVTSIGQGAFSNCDTLTHITLPDTIASIGTFAFGQCYKLTSINIPNGITCIEDSTFSSCVSLTSIILPESITSIGYYAFGHCNALTSINIPNGIISIEDSAFSSCWSLTSLNLPNGITRIGNEAFDSCYNLTNINLPNSITSIGKGAFRDCSKLISINIPDSITQINADTFYRCNNLEKVIIPKSVQAIAINAFISTIHSPEGTEEVLPEKLVINTYSGAYAETFAKENNIPYKLLDVIEDDKVTIKDSKLKTELLKYDINKDGELSKNEMQNIRELRITDNKGITDLTGLEYATNMEGIDFMDNKITNISPLANLKSLKYLVIMNANISDISPLASLTSINNLSLYNNNITDISALANLKSLKYLTISDNNVSDISTLANLTFLESLWLDNNQITDISSIANLINLEDLRADSNKISDISCLKNLRNIKYLFLGDNNITDISVVSNLNNLVKLEMSDNKIKNINSIANLANLIDLGFSNNQITDISCIPADRIINSVIIYAPNVTSDLEEIGVCIDNNYIDFTEEQNKQILDKFIKAQEKWREQGATNVKFILDMVFRYTPQKTKDENLTDPETKPLGVYNNLVPNIENVVPFVLTNRDDKVTIKDLKNISQFDIVQFNEQSINNVDDQTIVTTGDTFKVSGESKEYKVLIYGDVDKDGSITILDALAIQRYKLKLIDLDGIQLEAANVVRSDKSGVNIVDALYIQRYKLKLTENIIDKLPKAE